MRQGGFSITLLEIIITVLTILVVGGYFLNSELSSLKLTTGEEYFSIDVEDNKTLPEDKFPADPRFLFGLWKLETGDKSIFIAFNNAGGVCSSWSGKDASTFTCHKYEPYSTKGKFILLNGLYWMEWGARDGKLELKPAYQDAPKEIYTRLSEKIPDVKISGPSLPSGNITFEKPPPNPYEIKEPISFPSGAVALLFSKGWNKPDEPGGGIVYRDEKTEKIIPVNRSPLIPISYYARERSGDIFFIEDMKAIYRGDFNFRPIKKIAGGVRATDLHIPSDGPYIAFTNIEIEKPAGTVNGYNATDITTTVYAAKVDGTEQFKIPIPKGVNRFIFNSWLPGNKKLLLQSDNAGAMILYEVDLPLKKVKKFDRYTDYLYADMPIPVFSPDGQRFVYIKDDGVHAKAVWVSNSDGSDPKRVFGGGDGLVWASWANDSKKFMVISAALTPGTEDDTVLFFDRDGKFIREFIPDPVGEGLGPALLWSDDSRYLFLATEQSDAALRPGKIIVYDFVNDKIAKEFSIEGLKIPKEKQTIWKEVASPSGKVYYEVIPKNFAETLKIDDSFPQLWVIDIATMEKKKISDNASNSHVLVIP